MSRIIAYPGLKLQELTTKEPDDSQLEVAIEALKKAEGIKDKNKKIIDIDSVNICNDNKNINWRVNSTIVAIDDSIKCIDE